MRSCDSIVELPDNHGLLSIRCARLLRPFSLCPLSPKVIEERRQGDGKSTEMACKWNETLLLQSHVIRPIKFTGWDPESQIKCIHWPLINKRISIILFWNVCVLFHKGGLADFKTFPWRTQVGYTCPSLPKGRHQGGEDCNSVCLLTNLHTLRPLIGFRVTEERERTVFFCCNEKTAISPFGYLQCNVMLIGHHSVTIQPIMWLWLATFADWNCCSPVMHRKLAAEASGYDWTTKARWGETHSGFIDKSVVTVWVYRSLTPPPPLQPC
jgi:hypothetical protein